MLPFAGLLKHLMDSNGYTTYQLSALSGVNRTTLQRAITGERIPQAEAIDKLTATLKLTVLERNQLMEAYEIATEGEYKFKRRRCVKKLFENLTLPSPETVPTLLTEEAAAFSPAISISALIEGSAEIRQMLRQLLKHEFYKHEFPQISFMLPMSEGFLNGFFSELDNAVLEKLHISQLIYLTKIPEVFKNYELHNLTVLSNILPLVLRSASDYNVYYSYLDSALMSEAAVGFPYYIFSTDHVMLLSSDMKTALVETSEPLLYYIRNTFASAINQSKRLITRIDSLWDFLLNNLELDMNTHLYYSIEYQPCFLSFCSKELLYDCINSDLPNKEQLLKMACDHIGQHNFLLNSIVVFNSNSLENFIHDGIITSIPRDFIRPFNIEERIYLLNQLENCCREEKNTVRAINTSYFKIDSHIYLSIHKNQSIALYTYNPDKESFCLVKITEATIYEAFYDFIQHMMKNDSGYLYTKEETLTIILHYKKRLMRLNAAGRGEDSI